MLTRREVEWGLRELHPFREQSRRKKQALAKIRRRLRITLGVLLGAGIVAAIGVVNLLRSEVTVVTSRQAPVWGEVRVSSADDVSRPQSFLPEAWRRARHPFDPVARTRVLREKRRAARED